MYAGSFYLPASVYMLCILRVMTSIKKHIEHIFYRSLLAAAFSCYTHIPATCNQRLPYYPNFKDFNKYSPVLD